MNNNGVKYSEIHNNYGSTIIEVTLIMPIIIAIIVSVIFLFIDIINDAVVQGNGYCGIYTVTVGDSEESIRNEIYDAISDEITGIGNTPDVIIGTDKGEITANIYTSRNSGGNVYIYRGEDVCCKREYDKCSQRLRRWQLYGDVLREQGSK